MTDTQALVDRLAGEAGFQLWARKGAILIEGTNVAPELAKFAELVARECRTLCLDVGKDARGAAAKPDVAHHDADAYVDGYQDSAVDCDEAIRQRFGVKE